MLKDCNKHNLNKNVKIAISVIFHLFNLTVVFNVRLKSFVERVSHFTEFQSNFYANWNTKICSSLVEGDGQTADSAVDGCMLPV